MKELMGKIHYTESRLPEKLVIERKETTEMKDKAEKFSNFLTNVVPDLTKKSLKFFKLIH